MINPPRAFFAVDLGSATTSGSVLGHIGGRWRLVAHAAAPSHVQVDSLLGELLVRIELTDPEMMVELAAGESPDIPAFVATWPRLVAQTTPRRRIAVLAGSRRERRRLEDAALRAGWLVVGGSADEDDPIALTRLILSTDTAAVLLGADHSLSGDEKRHLPDLAALVAAAAQSRPELTVVLAGGAAAYESAFASQDESGSPDELPAGGVAGSEASVPPPIAVVTPTPTPAAPASSTAVDIDQEPAPSPAKRARKKSKTAGASSLAPDAGGPGEAVAAGAAPKLEAGPAGSVAASTAFPSSTAPVASTAGSAVPAYPIVESLAASTHVLLAPDAAAGQPAGSSLQQVLEGLRAAPNDSRIGVARSIASLAYVLDRSIEVFEVGLGGGLRARSEPVGQGHFAVVSSYACLAEASFAPADPSEEVIDALLEWSTVQLDRHRAMDRLNDLRLTPWGEADGDGAVFRLAAAKAAFGRLKAVTPDIDARPLPELLVAAGGVFSALPPSVVALALADLVRRPGVTQLAIDQARLLGPLGAIEDEAERRRFLANLADDILIPLGSLILPAGVRQGRSAGFLRTSSEASSEIELHPGAVQVVDLPPGRSAQASLDFRDAVRLGTRGRHFTVDVGGGLGGLLVDLRDIPMRISDRPDSRRAELEAWQRGMWPELEE